MSEARIAKSVFLKAPPERVWAFLTEPALLARWFHESDRSLVQGDAYGPLRDGGRADQKPVCWGRVLEASPPRRLVYTFTHDHLKALETLVQWTLTAVGRGTMLELVHDGFDEESGYDLLDMLADHDQGWDDHFVRFRKSAAEAR